MKLKHWLTRNRTKPWHVWNTSYLQTELISGRSAGVDDPEPHHARVERGGQVRRRRHRTGHLLQALVEQIAAPVGQEVERRGSFSAVSDAAADGVRLAQLCLPASNASGRRRDEHVRGRFVAR